MKSRLSLKAGDKVRATSFSGQKIIGIFVKYAPSFGVFVLGTTVERPTEPQEYHCPKLSLEWLERPSVPSLKSLDGQSLSGHRFVKGDPCTGRTTCNHKILGTYAGSANAKYSRAGLVLQRYAYINGWIQDKLLTRAEPERFKVIRDTLVFTP